MRKLIFFLLVNTLCLSASAQKQKGMLIIRTLPSNAVVYINDQKFENTGEPIPFDAGNFNVKIWSMEYDMYTDTFSVAPGEPTIIRVRLLKNKSNVAESIFNKEEKESFKEEERLISFYQRKS
jgi:hypothetical protein